jgi:hypothetical protein
VERRGVKKHGASELDERRPPINPARLPRKEAKFLRNVGFWLRIVDVCLYDLQERSARNHREPTKKMSASASPPTAERYPGSAPTAKHVAPTSLSHDRRLDPGACAARATSARPGIGPIPRTSRLACVAPTRRHRPPFSRSPAARTSRARQIASTHAFPTHVFGQSAVEVLNIVLKTKILLTSKTVFFFCRKGRGAGLSTTR